MYFSYDGESYEVHETAESAKAVADAALADYRSNACEGWDDEAYNVAWGRIIQCSTITESRPRTEEDFVDSLIDTIESIELVGCEEYRCAICGGLVVFDGTKPTTKSMR